MDRRFRNLILHQVEEVVHNQPPSRQALYDLLHIATPSLKVHAVDRKPLRESAYRTLLTLLHPDKHDSKERQRVTQIFQETAAYYKMCCGTLAAESPCLSSNRSYDWAGRELHEEAPRPRLTTMTTSASATTSSRPTAHCPSRGRTATASNERRSRPERTPQTTYHYYPNPSHRVRDHVQSTSPVRHHPRGATTRRLASVEHDVQGAISLTHHRTKKSPPRLDEFGLPIHFDAFEQWDYCEDDDIRANPNLEYLSDAHVAWITACRLLNQRGAIVHGQEITHPFTVSTQSKELQNNRTVDDVLRHFGLVCFAQLRSIPDIKRDIVHHGPVVSVSFQLAPTILQSHPHQFAPRLVRKAHPVVIVGWAMTPAGQVWKVQGLKGGMVPVGMGQFDMETAVFAPPADQLESIPWQAPGPYLDLQLPHPVGPRSPHDWRDLRFMTVSITPHELQVLANLYSGGFPQMIARNETFVLRDKFKLAFSRRYTLREVTNCGTKWKISVSLAEVREV
jgi:hypothetical protein